MDCHVTGPSLASNTLASSASHTWRLGCAAMLAKREPKRRAVAFPGFLTKLQLFLKKPNGNAHNQVWGAPACLLPSGMAHRRRETNASSRKGIRDGIVGADLSQCRSRLASSIPGFRSQALGRGQQSRRQRYHVAQEPSKVAKLPKVSVTGDQSKS